MVNTEKVYNMYTKIMGEVSKAIIGKDEIKEALKKIIPPTQRARGHELFIRLGRDYCTARNPSCNKCPLMKLCKKIKV